MALLRIFGVYDSKAKAWLQPFFVKNKVDAIRAITNLVNEDKHNFNLYAADYVLFELAEFNEETGDIKSHPAKVNLGVLVEFKRSVGN